MDSPKSFGEFLADSKAKEPTPVLVQSSAPQTTDEAVLGGEQESEVVNEAPVPKPQFPEQKSVPASLKPVSIHKGEVKTSVESQDIDSDDQSPELQPAQVPHPAQGPISAWMAAHGLTVSMLHAFKAEQSQDKHLLISDFVQQMKKQFGVSAEQVVKAFQKMEAKDLQLPPDQTAQKFLNNLNLNPEQKPQAALLYKNLLQKTEALSLNEKLAERVIKLEKFEAKSFSKKQQEPKEAFIAADKIAGKIAVAPLLEAPGASSNPELAELFTKVSPDETAPPEVLQAIEKLKASSVAEKPQGLEQKGNETKVAVAPIVPFATDSVQGPAPVLSQAAAIPKAAVTQTSLVSQGRADSAESLAALMPGLAAITSRFSQNGKQDNSGARDQSGKSMLGASLAKQSKAEIAAGSDNKGFSALMQTQSNQAAPGTTAAVVGAGQLTAPISAQDRADNLNEIISKAQFIAKNGGGEMKVELKGNEMGPMNLKVSIDKGQVSIQMVTQSEKTRKLIEDNLQDLKTSLSTHKLHVDDLKVELADGFQKQMDGQNSQQSREQSREAAAQFLSNMRDDRESNRQGFFDSSGWRPSRRDPSEREVLAPAPAAKTLAAMQARRSNMGSSRRLNLVA
jgi:flagellar hook-length control protein FliK